MSNLQDKIFDSSVVVRFLNNLELTETGCIEYNVGLTGSGYGRISIGPRDDCTVVSANRWALQFVLGGVILPSEVLSCHHCDNPACVHPGHLFPGSHALNMADMKEKGRAAISFGYSKLNWTIVDDIRSSPLNGVQLAVKYDVVKSTISEIRNHHIWKEEHRSLAQIPDR